MKNLLVQVIVFDLQMVEHLRNIFNISIGRGVMGSRKKILSDSRTPLTDRP